MTSEKVRLARIKKLREKGYKSGKELLKEVISKYQYPIIMCSFSGGRDSLSATLLTLDTLVEMKKEARLFVAFVNTTNEYPETLKYARYMIKEWFPKNYGHYDWIDLHCVELKPDVFFKDIMDDMFKIALEMARKGEWSKGKMPCCHKLKFEPLRKFAREVKSNIQVEGTRAEESRRRFIQMWRFGVVIRGDTPYGVRVMPIWDWSLEDVKRFLAEHPKKPPINPLYKTMKSTGCLLCPIPFIFYPEEFAVEAPPHIFKAGLRAYLKALGQSQLTFDKLPVELDSIVVKLMKFLEKPRTREEIEKAGFNFETVEFLLKRKIINSKFDWRLGKYVYYA